MVKDKTDIEVIIRDMLKNYDRATLSLEHQMYFNRGDVDKTRRRLSEYKVLYEAVQKLNERQRIAISSLYFPANTLSGAAEMIGCDRSTVYRNVNAGIKVLSKRLAKIWDKPDKT